MNAKAENKEAVQVSHKNVWTALAAAQAQMGKLVKDSLNPHFKSKYADLADVMATALPALNANGLTIYHQITNEGHTMRTVLMHGESETSIECDVPLIVAKNDMQGFKSATTYAKRIGAESVTGLAPDDDDGNAAAAAAPKPISAAAMKRGLEEIDNDLADCTSLYEVNKCAKVWAEIMETNGWSAEYRDFAKPKFAKRRADLESSQALLAGE
jgi:hypothetical protein